MKIGILNAYDARNMGDYAIVDAQIAWLKSRFPQADIRVISDHATNNALFFGPASVESVIHVPPYGSFFERLTHPVVDWLTYKLVDHKRRGKLQEFDSCDAYALCGGGYLYSSVSPLLSRNLIILCLNALLAIKTGKPFFHFPQSYGPITKWPDRMIVSHLLATLEVAVIRSELSMDFMKEEGYESKAVVIPDVALALTRLRPEYFCQRFPRRGLGITPINFSFAMKATAEELETYMQKLVEVAKRYHRQTGEPITLFQQVSVTQKDDDSIMVMRIQSELTEQGVPVTVLKPGTNLRRYLVQFQKMRAVIGCRMHACIFSLLAGTPTIGLGYQPKFSGTFSLLGFEDWVAPITDWSVDWACEKIEYALKNEAELRAEISTAVARIGTQIDEGLGIAFEEPLKRLSSIADSSNNGAAPSLANEPDETRVRLSIITPSFRSGRWLKLCIASVADQEGVQYEHIVQDSCSDDETRDWLPGDTRVKAVIEKDKGMYDAVNRGFRRATGNVLAYINCDEQYLPGALKKVADYFESHPNVDVLLADTIVVNPDGKFICERRSLPPQLCHTLVGTTLSFLTSGLFIRRRVLEKHQLFFDTNWRDLGDAEWALRAIRAGVRFGILRDFTSSFTDTGANMNLLPNARKEFREMHASAPLWMRATSWIWVLHYRLRRLLAGLYFTVPYGYEIYTHDNPDRREMHYVEKPTFRWLRPK